MRSRTLGPPLSWGSGCTRRQVETEPRGLLRYGDLQLGPALSRRRVLVPTQANGCVTAQSGNVEVSSVKCGTPYADVQEPVMSLIR